MSLKTLGAEIRRTAKEARERFEPPLMVMFIGVMDCKRDAEVLPCFGWSCEYELDGIRRQLFFPGTERAVDVMARALIDYAHSVERGSGIRAAAVLMQKTTPPDDAVIVVQPPEGIPPHEHAARLYDALRRH